jgi:NhaP-type Na+/H+ or K+/H+ antiporter
LHTSLDFHQEASKVINKALMITDQSMQLSDTSLLALIALSSIACQWLAWRLKLPAILFLLLTGIILGPMSHTLDPDALFGDLLFPVVSLSIAIILFEGSLTLHFNQVRDVSCVVRRLVTVGALITWSLIALASYWIIGLPAELAALFGALVVVTGPTVISPMLRTLRATSRIANVLRWEGIIIDPIGALMAVLVFEWVISSQQASGLISHTLLLFGETILIGAGLGALAAFALAYVIRHHWLPEYLHAFGTLALVLTTFTISNHLAHESGLLAVTIMGIWLANAKGIHIDEILSFKENLTLLLISGLFILLAARLNLDSLLALGLPALGLLAVIQFVVRPISVGLCSIGSDLSWQERGLIAWVGPRGIVAAAVSVFFALRLEESGYANADILTALTFSVIIGTVVFQSATARFVAQKLGVTEPEPTGLVIIGANKVARTIAQALQQQEVPTLLIDPSWENIREARMAGFKVLHGNPLSTRVAEKLELGGYGQLLAATPQHEINTLVCLHFRREFETRFIYAIKTEKPNALPSIHAVASDLQGNIMGRDGLSFRTLSNLISNDASAKAPIKATKLTAEYTLKHWEEENNDRSLLMAITPNARLRVFSPDETLTATEGWTLLSIEHQATGEKRTV